MPGVAGTSDDWRLSTQADYHQPVPVIREAETHGGPSSAAGRPQWSYSFNSYPLGRPAQAGAIASLEDEAWFQQGRARVIEGRERLTLGLIRLGFDVLPSSANFVFARHPAQRGAALAAALRQRAVIVRHFAAPRIADYLRITVGTDGQIDRLLSALADILGGGPASA